MRIPQTLALTSFLTLSYALEAKPVTFDKTSGTVEWEGSMIAGESHKGTIALKSGSLDLDAKKGEFVIDMNTIEPVGMSKEQKNKLAQHLSYGDFFDTVAHPEAKLVVKDIQKLSGDTYKIKGDLTIRGQTNEETFEAQIAEKNKRTTINAKLGFDRSRYKQTYQIESDASALDKAKQLAKETVSAVKTSVIRNQVNLSIKLQSL